MKHTKRKLLSLLLALAVICSMVPAAMAYGNKSLRVGETDTLDYSYSTSNYAGFSWSSSDYSVVTVSAKSYSYINNTLVGGPSATITAHSAGTATINCIAYFYNPLTQRLVPAGSDEWTVEVTGSGTVSGYHCSLSQGSMSLSVGGGNALTAVANSGCSITSVSWGTTSSIVSLSTSTGASTYVTGVSNGTTTVTATVCGTDNLGRSFTENLGCTVYVGTGSGSGIGSGNYAIISQNALSLNVSASSSLSVSPLYSNYYISSVSWASSNPSIASVVSTDYYGTTATVTGLTAGTATIYASVSGYYNGSTPFSETLICTVTVGGGTNTGYDTGHFYISSSSLQLEPNGGYTLLTATPYPNSGITSANLESLTWYSSDPSIVSLYYNGNLGGNTATGSSVYVYGLAVGKATITAYLDGNRYATCEVTVGSGSASIDVLYCLTKGQSKALDASDFTSFWNNAAGSRGTLQYVTFGTASGSVGKLTYTRTGSSQSQVTSATKFYVSPSGSQYGINSVTFTPNKSGSSYATGTLAVPFTAYGTTSYYGSVTTTLSGMLYIVVTNGEVQDISYQTNGSALTLDPNDFVSVYRQALSTTTANPTVYIQFLDVPSFGDLYYNYNASRYTSGVKLTASNIGTMRFSSRTTGTYGIDDVTYVPASTKSGDTIRYAAYSSASGGTLLYVGEINFGVKEASAVKFYGTTNSTVKLNSSTFYTSEALTYTEYISFGAPSSGTLYKDYANGSGTKVTAGSTFTLSTTGSYSVPSVNSLTFVPKSGFSGVVEIPFTCYNILGGQASGTVKIYIAKTFSDVPTSHWAYGYVTQLTAEGIVNGMTKTTFAPSQNLKYGEALKLIMEAVGYPKLEKTGTHWASGYLSRAYRDGLVSSSNINLESYIDRTTVASITAKALGLSKATSINAGITGPSDSTDGYVYALYNAGILEGENRNGKNYYDGSSTLTRAQVCAIVCRVSEYNK